MDALRRLAILLVCVSSVVVVPAARAETINCTSITSVPGFSSPNRPDYRLAGNLSTPQTTGSAIEIQANNVVLDLNGYRLNGRGAGPGTNARGINALNRQNITIRNGSVRGFVYGIVLEMGGGVSQGHMVEDVRAEQNTLGGINVQGAANIVRNNHVVDTGGSTVLGSDAAAFGIYMVGTEAQVLNNDVSRTTKQGFGTSTGMWLALVTSGFVVNNRVASSDQGFVLGGTKYRDNLTSNVSFPYLGGTDAGNNR